MKKTLTLTAILCLAFTVGALLPVVTAAAGGGPSSGDVNGDGSVNVADAVYLLSFLFSQGPEPVPVVCDPAATIEEADAAMRARAFQEAQAFGSAMGLTLDEESVTVLSFDPGVYVDVVIDGFDQLEGPDDFFTPVDVAVVYFGFPIAGPPGGPPLPPGFYVHRVLFDPDLYAAGDPNFARTWLVDATGNAIEMPTSTQHFPGSHPISQLGPHSSVCEEANTLKGRRYVSCPQLGDILAMTCFDNTWNF